MIPVTRKEQYLNRLTGEEQAIPETPITRTEQYLARLCGMETEIPSSPITREEAYLAYLNGEDVTLPEPITRLEQFMAFAAEKSETKPIPLTREEFYWDKYQGGQVPEEKTIDFASIITVTDALAKPLKACTVKINPVQSGSGDPSPDNIRPISGWTGATVTRCGKNLTQSTGIITGTTGGINNQLNEIAFVESNKEYCLSFNSAEINAKIIRFYIDNILISEQIPSGNVKTNKRNSKVINTVTSGTLSIGCNRDSFTPNISVFSDLQLEIGNQATSYEPYTGHTYPITFPSEAGTVYGGTLDVTNGTLTVDRVLVDLGTLGWLYYKYGDIDGGYSDGISSLIKKPQSTSILANAISDRLSQVQDSVFDNSGNGAFAINVRGRIKVHCDGVKTAQELKTAVSGVQLVYELATPITYQLTPTEVQMLLGTNNIWADTGDISITYLAKGGKAQESNRSMALNLQKLSTPLTDDVDEEEVETEPEEQEENADER